MGAAGRSVGLGAAVAMVLVGLATPQGQVTGSAAGTSPWPAGKRGALSLSFDDARPSQLDAGMPLFAEYGARVTFYLEGRNVAARASEWRRAAGAGHEMGNHSMTHPCTGNFGWSRDRALESFTLDRIRADLTEANDAIERATGVRPVTFAYPCGQKFVGRGRGVTSYVPVVSELFLAGRGWLDEGANDPSVVDLAQILGYPMDDVDFETLKPVLDEAMGQGRWLVLAGHDIGAEPGHQVTRLSMLRALLAYADDPAHGVWLETVGHVAEAIGKSK
jgi:peptidoglycan/xylan/chitin deacetylase (PgdA/CDA1 family)